MAGVVLALWTFADVINGELSTFWQDNNSVLYAILAGGGKSPEVNSAVGHLWLKIAGLRTNFRIGRVESWANVADGPTRGCSRWIYELNAEFREPRFPGWLVDPWLRVAPPWDC